MNFRMFSYLLKHSDNFKMYSNQSYHFLNLGLAESLLYLLSFYYIMMIIVSLSNVFQHLNKYISCFVFYTGLQVSFSVCVSETCGGL